MDDLPRSGTDALVLIGIADLDEMNPEECYAGWDVRLETDAGLNAVMDVFMFLEEDSELEVEEDPIDEWAAVSLSMDRPDIRQMELLEKVFKRNYGAQRAFHYPFLSINGSYGFVGREFEGLDDDGHDFWNASVTLTLPVFDGFLTKGRLRKVGASIQRTREEREELSRQARLEVLSLYGELEAARANLSAAELLSDGAEGAVRAFRGPDELDPGALRGADRHRGAKTGDGGVTHDAAAKDRRSLDAFD